MKCNYCYYYTIECRNPEVDYELLDHFNWEEETLPLICNHFDPVKDILVLKDINLNSNYATAEITLAVDFVILKVLIYKGKYDNSYYCKLPGEKTNSEGLKYYGVSFGLYNYENEKNIMEIKKTLVELYLYSIGELDSDIFDIDYDILLNNYIISGSTYFNALYETDAPF